MRIDIMESFDRICNYIDEEHYDRVYQIYDAVDFKFKKNLYHYENIERVISDSSKVMNSDYSQVYLPIYYEIEGILTSLRSSVDILLHLINETVNLKLNANEVTLYNVYTNKKLPSLIKNAFNKYTRTYDNPIWNFIYTFRNEIVHEKSVKQVLPIKIDLFTLDIPSLFFEFKGRDKDLLIHFDNCIRFLERFASQVFQSIEVYLETEKRKK